MKKHEELYRRLRNLLESGAIRNGERLPSIREEASASGMSINTVVAAYGRLLDAGLVWARERGGYYARTGALKRFPEGIGGGMTLPERFVSTAREAGERLDLVFERLSRIDPSFAVASPGTELLPADRIRAAFARPSLAWVGYSDSSGDHALRRRIAMVSEPLDGPTNIEDIVVSNGATEALALVFRVVLRPGDTVVLESPTYFHFFRQLAPLGVEIVEVPVGREGMDLDMLESELDTRQVRAIVVQPNVQNPTGTSMSDEAKARIVALAAGHGAILIQDDVYGDLYFGLRRPRNLSSFSDYAGTMLVSSYSKTVAPGLRIGWVRAPAFAEAIAEEKLRSSMDSCRLAQAALADFIGSPAHRRHMAALRSALEGRIDEHIEFLSCVLPAGCSVRRPTGGCLLWISFPPGTDATGVFERSARKGLIAAPGEIFSSSSFFRNCLRLNAGRKLTQERKTALSVLEEALGPERGRGGEST